MARYPNGFLPFGSDDEDIVLRAALKSATADEAGYSFGVSQAGAVLATDYSWSENGMMLVNSVPPIRWILNTLPRGALFSAHGNISFEVEKAYFSNLPAATKYMVSTTRAWFQQTTTGNVALNHTQASAFSNTLNVSAIGKGSHVRVDITYQEGDAIVSIDYLPMARFNLAPFGGTVTDLYAQGLTATANSGNTNIRIRNLQLSHRPQRYPTSGSILFLGDSFTEQGNVASTITGGNHKNWWFPGYGFAATDAVATAGTYADVGLQATLFRELSKNGIWTNDNFNYAKAGGTVDTATTKFNEFLANNKGKVPKVVLILCGTNDTTAQTAEATTAARFQTLLTAIYNAGVRRVACWKPPSLHNDPTYNTSVYDAVHVTYNRVVESTNVTYCAAQGYPANFYTVIPAFEKMGGHSIDSAMFQTANLHPNQIGSYELGRIVGASCAGLFS